MGKFIQDFGAGEVIPLELRHFLQVDSSGNPTVCLRDLCDYPQDMDNPRKIPPLTGPPSGGNSSKAKHARAVEILTSGRSNAGDGDRLGRDIFTTPTEHHHPVYRDSSNTGYMPGI